MDHGRQFSSAFGLTAPSSHPTHHLSPLLVFNINEVTLNESSICVSPVINTLLSKKAQVSLKCIKPQTLRQLVKPFDCEDEHALLPPSQHDRPTWHLTELVLFPYFMM